MRRFEALKGALRVRDFRWMWLGQLTSELGDWAARLALAVLVFDRTHSSALAALVTAASLIPWVGVGQVLATFGDRWPRRRVMVAADVVRAVVFLAMAAVPMPVWLLVAGALIAGLATPPFAAARSALMADVVPAEHYPAALVVHQVTLQSGAVGGYLVGGVLVAAFGARVALAVDGATFVASALALVPLAARPLRPAAASTGARLHAAFAAVRSDRLICWAIGLAASSAAGATVGEALVAPAGRSAGFSTTTIGVLAATVALGATVAALAVPAGLDDRRLLRAAAILAAAGSFIGIVGFLLPARMPSALLPYIGIGIVFAVALPTNAVAGGRLPSEVRSSAFGMLVGLLMGAQAAGAALGGVAAGWFGNGTVQAAALVPVVVFAGVALLRMPAPERRARPVVFVAPAAEVADAA
jgi:predicted MFS family arabinose efflux permease